MKDDHNIDDVISINLSDGISDTNKIEVFKEFKKISLNYKNTFKKRILFLNILIYFLITKILKILLPNQIIHYLYKLKNR